MPIVYSYHCEPAEEQDELALIDQLRLAAQYRRALAESENRARALWRSWSSLVAPAVRSGVAAARRDERVRDLIALRRDVDRVPGEDWRRESRDGLAALGLPAEVADRLAEREDIAAVHATHDRATRRAFSLAGLSWGTYQHVEEAHATSCRTTTRERDVWVPPVQPVGCVAVHLQPARPLREDDPWIRVGTQLVVRTGWQRIGDRFVRRRGDLDLSGRVRPARHREVWLRIGTLPLGGPRWVRLLALLDRELPPDAKVSWAMVARRRIADAHRWELKVVLEAPSLAAEGLARRSEAQPMRVAGVDVGWRQIEGRTRIAVWWGTDGRSGEVSIPSRVLGADDKSDSLRAIRDRARDALRARLVEWAQGRDLSGTWLEEALAGLPLWQRYGRFARLARIWERAESRVPEDDEVRAELLAWFRQNRHLWRWEAFGRRKRGTRVAEVIRQFVVWLCREYGRIGIEQPFVAKLVQKGDRCDACRALPRRCATCQEREQMRRVASTRVPHAAPARTRDDFRRFAQKYGAVVVELDPANTTLDCSSCGHRREEVLDWSACVVGCASCGAEEDQDVTSAKNLARLAAAVQLDAAGRPLVEGRKRGGARTIGPRRTRRAPGVGTQGKGPGAG